nr:hypothetical protein Iba_chr12aCG15060 [Ipomoea batatas]
MISATFSVSRSNSSKEASKFQFCTYRSGRFAEVRTPHCRNARKPAGRRTPQSASHRSLEHRPLPASCRSPPDAHILPLTGVTARRRYIPESRPFETIAVPKLQKAATSTLPGSSRQQCSLQWVSSQFYFLIFFFLNNLAG